MLKPYSYYKYLSETELSYERFEHSLNVLEAALDIRKRYDIRVSEQKLKIACILHDYCRNWSKDKLLAYCVKYKLKVLKHEMLYPVLLHAPVAADIFNDELSEDIILAIRFHTLGSSTMGKIGALVYCADYLNIGRDYMDEDIYEAYLSEAKSLEELVILITKHCSTYQEAEGKIIAKVTKNLLKYLDKGNSFA